jgi:FkbM family methyltransferase
MFILKYFFRIIYKLLTVITNKIGYKLEAIDKKSVYNIDLPYNKLDNNKFESLFDKIINKHNINLKYITYFFIDSFSFIYSYKSCLDKINEVFNMLEDDISKEVYYNVIKFRLTYAIKRIEDSISPTITLDKARYPVPTLHGTGVQKLIQYTYYNCQYEIPGIFEATTGDIVFDIGGYIGDTALYFSSAVQDSGLVYSFEPNKELIPLLRENIIVNNRKNIVIVENGLYDYSMTVENKKTTDMIYYDDIIGNATHELNMEPKTNEVNSKINLISLDDYIKINNILKINLIKMDIEGAEENALIGAKNTIIQFKPKLAISIYHKYQDLYNLALLIKSFQPEYKFYIRHTTNDIGDTILFCL